MTTPGPWRYGEGESGIDPRPAVLMNFDYEEGEWYVSADFADLDEARFATESREGWPEAIRRAIAAEAELAAEEDKRCHYEMQADELALEIERLRAVLDQFDDRKHAMMPRSQMARIAKEALDASPSEFVDVTESRRWLKALVSALDDGRIQQTRLSSGTDYVILGAREHVRKLNTEVTADATR
ncbi:hypothetical protein [Paenibacillus amylolyticus]|uniref:hypothetical protein n=1 Tax=Paenibacillus amylolyticus TaxID=1451 RepID=UPI003EBE83B9